MDRLWAPWRASYIRKAVKVNPKGCVFCKSLQEFQKGKSSQVVEVSRFSFSILNIYPYNNGHLMVMPLRHVGNFQSLRPAELADMMRLLQKTQASLTRVLKPHAFNICLNLGREAGSGILDHLHFHIVPRWNGDTNFMPLLGGTKVISESLEAVRERLNHDIQKRNRRTRK